MTKYGKVKKMMKRTGMTKDGCLAWLRAYNWDLEKAVAMSQIVSSDFWEKAAKVIHEAIKEVTDALLGLVESVNKMQLETKERTGDEVDEKKT
jgi:hypothetical protein